MAGPLLTKRKAKISQKRLRSPRDYKQKGLISVLNRLLQKKQRCLKNLRFDFEDNSPGKKPKRVLDAEIFERFNRLADELLCDDDLLENCHRLVEQFETLKINKRADNAGRSEKFHHLADKLFSDGEDLLKNSQRFVETFETPKLSKSSQPKTEEDYFCVSMDVDEDDSGEFFKACQRSAKKIAVSKVFKDALSMEDLVTKPNSKKSICFDSIDNVSGIVPKPLGESKDNPAEIKHTKFKIDHSAKLAIVPNSLEDSPEKINIVKKQPEEKYMSHTPEKKVPENFQIVPKPAQEKKEMPHVVPKPPEKLIIAPKTLEKNTGTIQEVSKQLDKSTETIDTVTKQLEKNTEKIKTVVNIVPKTPEKLIDPLEKKSEKQEEGESKTRTQGLKDFRFSTAEKKKVGQYNSNVFNPGKPMDQPKPRPNRRKIIIDGSNVAFAHGRNTCFSSKGVQYCVQYFEKMGHDVKAVVPLFRRNAFQSTDHKILDQLHRQGKIVFTPCKNFLGQRLVSYDDRFVLQLAYEWHAVVVSNDNYRDLIDECPAIRMIVETRVLNYTWCNDILILAKDPYGRQGPTLDDILHY